MRNRHQRIVHDDGEVVGGRALGAHDHGIADDVGVEPDVAANGVAERDVAILGHAKANGRPLARGDARVCGFARELPARAGIAGGPAFGERGLAIEIELFLRAEAVVRVAGAQQLLGVGRVEVQPLRLSVRTAAAADVWPFIPIEAEPSQVADDPGFRFNRRSLDVGVFDAEDERPAGPAREKPIEHGGAHVADVQVAGGAGGEAKSHP